MLVEPVLAPLVDESDFGEFGAGLLAQAIAQRDAHGFAAVVARWLERP
jgi:hypothetical protein